MYCRDTRPDSTLRRFDVVCFEQVDEKHARRQIVARAVHIIHVTRAVTHSNENGMLNFGIITKNRHSRKAYRSLVNKLHWMAD
jgi:hypothetical protein